MVDNGSMDNTLSLVSKEYPEVQVIENNKNIGFGQANNIGVRLALENHATHIFLLNQDAAIQPDTLIKCLDVFQLKPNIALLSPIHLNGKGDSLDLGFQSCLTAKLCPDYVSDLVLGSIKESYKIFSVNAAAWLLKADILKQIGLFSDLFFHYGEDINFQQRLWYHGYEAHLSPKAFIYHDREFRQGEKSETGKKHEIKTNQMTILLNIQDTYSLALKKLLKYAGLLVFQGKPISGMSILFDTLVNNAKYKKAREDFKKGISI